MGDGEDFANECRQVKAAVQNIRDNKERATSNASKNFVHDSAASIALALASEDEKAPSAEKKRALEHSKFVALTGRNEGAVRTRVRQHDAGRTLVYPAVFS